MTIELLTYYLISQTNIVALNITLNIIIKYELIVFFSYKLTRF